MDLRVLWVVCERDALLQAGQTNNFGYFVLTRHVNALVTGGFELCQAEIGAFADAAIEVKGVFKSVDSKGC